jgi:hypothetical protein
VNNLETCGHGRGAYSEQVTTATRQDLEERAQPTESDLRGAGYDADSFYRLKGDRVPICGKLNLTDRLLPHCMSLHESKRNNTEGGSVGGSSP